MMFGSTKGGIFFLHYARNTKCFGRANQKTELFVYPWLCEHVTFDITCICRSIRSGLKSSVNALIINIIHDY